MALPARIVQASGVPRLESAESKPRLTALMHPRLHRAPFTRAGWIFEHKPDGFRALAWTGSEPALVSRNGVSYAAAFPEIIAALRRFSVAAVLDC